MSPVNILLVSKTSWRRLQDMSLRRVQDMSSRCLEDFFSITNFRLWRRLKTSCEMSSRRLQDVLEKNKTSWSKKSCYAEDVIRTSSRPATPKEHLKSILITWHILSSTDISIFQHKSANFAYQKIQIQIPFWYIISNYFDCFWVFKDFFDKRDYNFDDVSKIRYCSPS